MLPSASLHDATVILDDRPVLRGVTLDLGAGLTIVRGPNGAGKTTLLRVIAGLVPLARGARAVTATTLFIGHRPMLLRGLSARQNLTFMTAFRGHSGADVAGALERWGVGAVMDRPVERISAGQRRRVSLARIETEPEEIVLLDEPFADLDRDGVDLVRAAIANVVRDGRAVILVTHLHEELDREATRRVVVAEGEVRAA